MGSQKGHGTFSREMMLPELLRLFITPGNCGLCYFLIRLVLKGAGASPRDVSQRGQPLVPEDRCHPWIPGTGAKWKISDHLKEKGRWGL